MAKSKKKWIPSNLEKGRCTPGSSNYDCPKGSPQANLAKMFRSKKWRAKDKKKKS